MKKVIVGVTLAASLLTVPAHAHANGGYYSPWVPFGVGVVIGNILTQRPTYVYSPPPVYYPAPPVYYQQPVQPPTVYVYPSDAPVIPMPGQTCELRSEMVNGQPVTGNFCYRR